MVVMMIEYLMNKEMEKLYQAQTPQNEVLLRKVFYYKKSSMNPGGALVNFARSNAQIVYSKGYNQFANEIIRVSGKNKGISASEIKYLREHIKIQNDMIRVETQLKSPSAINDAFNNTKHEMMVDIISSVINFVESIVMHDNEETETIKFIEVLASPQKSFPDVLNSMRSILEQEIRLLRKFDLPTDPPPN